MAGLFKVLGTAGSGLVAAVEATTVVIEAGRTASKGLISLSAEFTARTEQECLLRAQKGGYEARFTELMNESKTRIN